MGELQLEVYLERIRREYRCEVVVGRPEVAYRETITRSARFDVTHRKQTGGPGQYARIVGRVEPIVAEQAGEPSREIELVDETTGGVIPRELMKAVERGFTAAFERGGLVGAPVVGVRVVIEDGATHDVDSREVAFVTVARKAWKEVQPLAGPVLLEPLMKVVVDGPETSSGAILAGLNRRRGVVQGSASPVPGQLQVTALVPLEAMFGYGSDLRSQTQGKAGFSMELARYAPVPRALQERLIAGRS